MNWYEMAPNYETNSDQIGGQDLTQFLLKLVLKSWLGSQPGIWATCAW